MRADTPASYPVLPPERPGTTRSTLAVDVDGTDLRRDQVGRVRVGRVRDGLVTHDKPTRRRRTIARRTWRNPTPKGRNDGRLLATVLDQRKPRTQDSLAELLPRQPTHHPHLQRESAPTMPPMARHFP
jgi:hypothetical protein